MQLFIHNKNGDICNRTQISKVLYLGRCPNNNHPPEYYLNDSCDYVNNAGYKIS